MSVHQCKKTGRWYVKYRVEGKQTSRWFGVGRLEKKNAEAFDFDLKAMKARDLELPKREGIFLDAVAQAYLNDAKMRGVSEEFLKTFPSLLNKYFLPKLTHRKVDDLEYADIIAAMQPFLSCEQSTRNRYMGYLRAVFRYGILHGMTENNPLAAWKKPKERPHQSSLTFDDLRLIMQHAAEHLQWAIEVEWNLGTRPGESELLSAKWDGVDYENFMVNVYASKTKSWRTIPVSPEFMARLKEKHAVAQSPYIIEYKGKGIRRIDKAWRTAAKKAGITYYCSMYDIRHLFATTLLNKSADLAAVSALLGHHSTHMTANQYYHLMAGEKRNAVKRLPSLNPSKQSPATVLPFTPKENVQ